MVNRSSNHCIIANFSQQFLYFFLLFKNHDQPPPAREASSFGRVSFLQRSSCEATHVNLRIFKLRVHLLYCSFLIQFTCSPCAILVRNSEMLYCSFCPLPYGSFGPPPYDNSFLSPPYPVSFLSPILASRDLGSKTMVSVD